MTTVPQQQPSSKQGVDGDDDRKPSSAVLALSDLLSNLPKTVPLADDSAGLRTSFALVDQIKMALQGTLAFCSCSSERSGETLTSLSWVLYG